MRSSLKRLKRRSVVKLGVLLCAAASVIALPGVAHSSRPAPPPQPCPNPPPVNITSPQVPADVCIPSDFPATRPPITFFDDFSWRSFIALVWPAQQGQRGTPDAAQTVSGPGPRVFETYKSSWEIFHKDGSAPAAWDVYEDKKFNPCGHAVQFGDVVIASFSKFADVGQADFGTLVGPLVAQNKKYTRYLTGFNRIEFDQIAANKWFLRANLGTAAAPLKFNDGAIDVKSAWIEMAGIPHPERYYKRTAMVLDLESNPSQCKPTEIGLVGLHIVQKTPSRPQWIWSSFEQIDNIPQDGAQPPFAFHDGGPSPMPTRNPIEFPPPEVPPTVFNVQRLKPIHPSTVETNRAYRRALAQQNSVWQFYQLVTTQWPVPGNAPNNDGSPANSFPGAGATATAFANVTMETFDQLRIQRGCMNCHNRTRAETDFLWVMNTHSFDLDPAALLKSQAFRDLKQLLEDHREDETQVLTRMMREQSQIRAKPAPAPRRRRRQRNR